MQRTATRPAAAGLRTAAGLLLLAIGYYAGAELGFALTFRPRAVSTLWLPNAILLSAFLLAPRRKWWMLLAAALPAHVATQIGAGVPWSMILAWFVSNSTEALIGAVGILWFLRQPIRLDKLQNVGVVLLFGVLLGPFLSSFLDAAFVALNDWGESGYWTVWRVRFFSNTLAAALAVPVILSWADQGRRPFYRASPARWAEALLVMVALLVVSYAVFDRLQAGPHTLTALLYAPIPLLLWAAVRFGPIGSSTCTLAVVVFAIWSSVHGRGPFVSPSPESNALSLQLLFFVMSLTLMTLAALIDERHEALKAARESEAGLQRALREREATEAMTEAENQILETIATGAPAHETLAKLVKLIEAESPGATCSILLLETNGLHAKHASGSSLPMAYVEAIDGMAIGPNAGSCGTAMFTGRRVIVTDVLTDPLWTDYRELAAAHGLRACWSTPIKSRKGRVLGSFAIYYRQPKGPTDVELKLTDLATNLASIVLERDAAEAESKQQRSELAHLGRVAALGGLSGALAHELSQPLAAILADAQTGQRLLERRPPEVGEVREILTDIVAAQERAGTIIAHLREFLSKRQGSRTPLDVNNVIGEVLQLLRRDLADRQVSVTLQSSPQLVPVLGDRVQLEQVLLNLIMNACEAMGTNRADDRKLTIRTSSPKEDFVQVSVADNGVGIPRAVFARIGEPFVTSKPHGLGLGLSIARSIVKAHGGRLWPAQNRDRGATFHLLLPGVGHAPLASSHHAEAARPASDGQNASVPQQIDERR
jgi:C4-dicarboxylate-specific signal transduction histidine kinase